MLSISTNEDGSIKELSFAENEHTGWICPRCGTIWSPYVKKCLNCNGFNISIEWDSSNAKSWSLYNEEDTEHSD
jgi:uncharacterized OB-fold protein